MLEQLKRKIYDVLVETDDGETIDRIVAVLLMILIFLNVIAVVIESVESVAVRYAGFFFAFELFSVAVFSVEYLLRLWIAPLDPRYAGAVRGRLRYALTPMAVIDLLAILPAFLPLFMAVDLRMMRVLRLFRLFRLLKLGRYVDSLDALSRVVRAKQEVLLVSTTMIVILLLFAGSLMYAAENEAQPDKFSDIPSALWWGIATLTTVGYGDVFPVTPIGKVLGGVIAFLGIGMFALPAGILASGFAEEVESRRAKSRAEGTCPHCGEPLE
ncbi:MAG: ion transporter [Acidobacteria bacterium]|nr:ion transporter [Acidobacteriota bacterium]